MPPTVPLAALLPMLPWLMPTRPPTLLTPATLLLAPLSITVPTFSPTKPPALSALAVTEPVAWLVSIAPIVSLKPTSPPMLPTPVTVPLAVRRLIYDEQERPIQWLHGLYRPDRYEYEMQLSRVGSIDAKVWVSTELSAQFN